MILLKKSNVLRPDSPPLVIVRKHNGDIRIIIDIKVANQAFKRSILTVEEIVQEMSVGCYFSKLDLRSGYHQLELHAASREITFEHLLGWVDTKS